MTTTPEQQTIDYLRESIQELRASIAREDHGWDLLESTPGAEFSKDNLNMIAGRCRALALKNPLIKRALALRGGYVHGGGVSITSREAAEDSPVAQLISEWASSEDVQDVLLGAQASMNNERSLGTDGNVFVALFTDPRTGRVRPRILPFDQMTAILTNPEDSSSRQFYRRTYSVGREARTVYHPALGYYPASRPRALQDGEVMWDAPVYHISVNGLTGWTWGIPDAYAASAWAMAYKSYLEDWALYMRAVAKVAFTATTNDPNNAAALRGALQQLGTAAPGSAFQMSGDAQLKAAGGGGANINSESGKPLAAMVAAATGVPVTMLLSDPGQTGARAVAETLDKPTEMEMAARQAVWAEFYRDVTGYVIDSAVRAPLGSLRGRVIRDEDGLKVDLGETDRTIDITYPDLSRVDINVLVSAITSADDTGKMPPLTTVRLLLEAFGLDDIDEILNSITDANGNWIDPAATSGGAAVAAFRTGTEPVTNTEDPVSGNNG